MRLEKFDGPYFWKKHNLNVTWDGFTGTGLRIHLVNEDVEPQIIDNALVMGDFVEIHEIPLIASEFEEN